MGIAATIGFFDGVHTGHRCLLGQLRERASRLGLQTMAITFSHHPALVYNPSNAPLCICSFEKRVNKLQGLADRVVVLDFDAAMARMTAEGFAADVLRKQLGVDLLLMGYNHRFGADGLKDFEAYRQICARHGIEAVRAARLEGDDVSSTLIRSLIRQADFSKAAAMLGWEYEFEGMIVKGYHNGTRIGFPTANLKVEDNMLIPCEGVYACWAKLAGSDERLPAMLNIGTRPTFNQADTSLSIEVHIIDWGNPRQLYGETMTVIPHSLIRHEANFPTINDLRRQLLNDKDIVTKKLR